MDFYVLLEWEGRGVKKVFRGLRAAVKNNSRGWEFAQSHMRLRARECKFRCNFWDGETRSGALHFYATAEFRKSRELFLQNLSHSFSLLLTHTNEHTQKISHIHTRTHEQTQHIKTDWHLHTHINSTHTKKMHTLLTFWNISVSEKEFTHTHIHTNTHTNTYTRIHEHTHTNCLFLSICLFCLTFLQWSTHLPMGNAIFNKKSTNSFLHSNSFETYFYSGMFVIFITFPSILFEQIRLNSILK